MATEQDILKAAIQHHQSGNFGPAEQLYQSVLQANPNHPQALYLLGYLASQLDQNEVAIQLMQRAIALESHHPEFYRGLGRIHKSMGQFIEAIEAFQHSTQLDPTCPLTHYELGIALNMIGQHQSARRSYELSIAILPQNADAYYNLAFTLHALGELEASKDSYQAAIRIRPDFPEAYNNLGKLLSQSGQDVEAIAAYRTAVSLRPDFAEAHYNLGSVLQHNRQYDASIQSYETALAFQPNYPEAANNLGNTYKALGNYGLSVKAYRQAIELRPKFADAYYNLGISLNLLGQSQDAVAAYQQSLLIRPDHPESHYNLAVAYQELSQTEAAIESYRRAYQLRPGYGACALVHQLQHVCDWRDLLDLTQEVISMVERSRVQLNDEWISPLTLLSLPLATSSEQQLQCAKSWVERIEIAKAAELAITLAHTRTSRSKLRLGYVSRDFGTHPVSYLIAELIEAHDRERFEVFGYSLCPSDDSQIGLRIAEAFDRFVPIEDMPFEEAAKSIARDQVDILIDLQGYTKGARTEIMAWRPAAIQVNYLGFPGTMGADFIDYILVDDFIVPSDQQPFFTERLVHLPGCFMVNDRLREIEAKTPSRSQAGLPENGFVFCAFSAGFKITPRMFELWLRLLEATPDSVLWLRLGNPTAIDNLGQYAQRRGISRERLVFAPAISMPDHLARHRLADLYLDTYPYNQHSTASDALRMGLPLVTLAGTTFASRVAGSLLRAVGLPELVTHSFEEYENLAKRLAQQPAELSGLRKKLARNLEGNPLFDGRAFAKKVERAYQAMWEIHQGGEAPRPLTIA